MQTSTIVIRGNPDDSAGTMNKKSPQMLVAFFSSYSSECPLETSPNGAGRKGVQNNLTSFCLTIVNSLHIFTRIL